MASILEEVVEALSGLSADRQVAASGLVRFASAAIEAFQVALAQRGLKIVPAELSVAQYEVISETDKMWRELNSGEVYRVAVGAAPVVDLDGEKGR